ncbi:MAG TPA: glycosyltransferase [Usitatibacter sp.]|nr:glycosyltransferase [Usitatibacter sp.]
MRPPRLSITVVTYHTDRAVLERAMASVERAVVHAREKGAISEATLFVVHNGPDSEADAVRQACASFSSCGKVQILQGHGNVGYGRANNLVLPRLESDLHLVMNPDVELDEDAIAAAIAVLRDDASIGAVAPSVRDLRGGGEHLCKRYPSVWVLFLRGFAPEFLRARFAATLDAYEMRDLPADRVTRAVPLASGCFMLLRTDLFRRLGGFDPRFFMYFEDYDLSLRIGREARVAYAPQARIVHHGGEASRKGARHVAWFAASAWRFFATHGWKLA